MSSFDPELWSQRSWAKYQKSISKKDPRADHQLDDDRRSTTWLTKIVCWCTERELQVVFCRRTGGIYLHDEKMIRISDRLMPRLQAYFMLHECGHFLIGTRKRDERFGMGWHTEDPEDKKTFHHRCDIVEEEFEAWYRGWKLAQRLELNVNKEDFDKYRVKMLKGYMCWALKVKGYGGRDMAPDVDCEKFDKLIETSSTNQE